MRSLLIAIPLILIAGCVGPPAVPPPAPPVVAAPPPTPAPAPVSSDWRDWPLTPGDWAYRRTDAGTEAAFGLPGRPVFGLACGPDRHMRFTQAGSQPMTIRTSSLTVTLADGRTLLAANAPVLDAMGFSRGRFVVERPGSPTLVIPAWPEILRVTEDCRN